MSWVLILNSNYTQKPPAVVGGYPSLVQAESAGDLATAFGEPAPDAAMGYHSVPYPYYTSYLVIPGAAANYPLQSLYCRIERRFDPDDGKLVRIKERFGA